jgi:tRNA nucleotidyltransferase (CCA-adding enzyme)
VTDWAELRGRVLGRIKPGPDAVAEVKMFTDVLTARLSGYLRGLGVEASVEAHGSVAHDTWLLGDHDLDVFIVLPSGKREDLLRVLGHVKEFLSSGWKEAYAEHPYVKAEMSGLSVDFVPCFRSEAGHLASSTDRTPLHTAWLRGRLKEEGMDEVRLLKQFMRGVGVYGAEIRVGGFSGYLAELMVVSYSSFADALGAASGWVRGSVVPTGVLQAEEARRRFSDPLVAVDPVDPGRNAASAVSETSMWSLVAAARLFLREPAERFFFQEEEAPDADGVLRLMGSTGLDYVFLSIEDPEPDVPDTLWGMLHKAERALGRGLSDDGFDVTRTLSWSDEAGRNVFVFELASAELPPAVKRLGPPVAMVADGGRFVAAYPPGSAVSGPGVEGDRWWVVVRRERATAVESLRRLLRDGGASAGVHPRLAKRITERSQILIGLEAAPLLEGGFTVALGRFVRGRPFWLG